MILLFPGNSDATGVSADPESEGAVMKSRGGFGHLGITVPDVFKARLPDGNSQIVRLYVFGPSGL